MSRIVRTVIVAFAIVLAGSPATAQSRKVLGWLSVGGGIGLAVAAFDYGEFGRRRGEFGQHRGGFCPRGHLAYDPTQWGSGCFNADLERPRLLLAGIGAIGTGVALLMLPETEATRDLDVQVSPERVTVRRRFGW